MKHTPRVFRVSWCAAPLALALALAGCASSSDQRKLEYGLNQLRIQNQTAPDKLSDVRAELQALAGEVSRLTGRVEELEYRLAQAREEARQRRAQAATASAAPAPALVELPSPASALTPESGVAPAPGAEAVFAPAPAPGSESVFAPAPELLPAPESGAAAAPALAPGSESVFAPAPELLPAPAAGAAVAPALEPAPAQSAVEVAVAVDEAAAPSVTSADALNAYQEAYGFWSNDEHDACIERFGIFLQDFPQSNYAGDAHYWRADCYYRSGDLTASVLSFNKVVADYAQSPRAPDALYRMGEALLKLGPSRECAAVRAFERVAEEYPASRRAEQATNQLQVLTVSCNRAPRPAQ